MFAPPNISLRFRLRKKCVVLVSVLSVCVLAREHELLRCIIPRLRLLLYTRWPSMLDHLEEEAAAARKKIEETLEAVPRPPLQMQVQDKDRPSLVPFRVVLLTICTTSCTYLYQNTLKKKNPSQFF